MSEQLGFLLEKIIALIYLGTLGVVLYKLRKDFRLWWAAGYTACFVGLFLAIRLYLLFTFPTVFEVLNTADLRSAFVQGFRFDLYTVTLFGGIFIIAFLLPIAHKKYYQILTLPATLIWCLLGWVCIGDTIYFAFVKRHTGSELLITLHDKDFILSTLFSHYLGITLLLTLLTLGLMIGHYRLVGKIYRKPREKHGWYIANLLLISGCMFMTTLYHIRPFEFGRASMFSALEGAIPAKTSLTINGAFYIFSQLRHNYTDFLPTALSAEESLERAKGLLTSPQETFDDTYPLMRTRHQFNINGKNYNLIILLLESWQFEYTDAFAGTHYGATPHLDKLIQKSLAFDNFYASGQRSLNGNAAILTGLSQIAGLPNFGSGLENYDFSALADILNKNKYTSFYTRGAMWNSQRIGDLAYQTKFQSVTGSEAITPLLNYSNKHTVGDYDALMFFAKQLKIVSQPFFAIFFSISTHPPFELATPTDWHHFPTNGPDEGYLNTLSFMDWSIGQFMEEFKKLGLEDNTILLVLADHTIGRGQKGKMDEKLHIPAFIYAPHLLKAKHTSLVGSQVDLIPTILDMLNISYPYSAMGNSLFDPFAKRFAFCSLDGQVLEWKTPTGMLEYNVSKRTGEQGNITDEDEKDLIALNRAVYELLTTDRWAPSLQ